MVEIEHVESGELEKCGLFGKNQILRGRFDKQPVPVSTNEREAEGGGNWVRICASDPLDKVLSDQ